MAYSKTKCHICGKEISRGGAASTSHFRAHVRRGQAREEERAEGLVFVPTGSKFVESGPPFLSTDTPETRKIVVFLYRRKEAPFSLLAAKMGISPLMVELLLSSLKAEKRIHEVRKLVYRIGPAPINSKPKGGQGGRQGDSKKTPPGGSPKFEVGRAGVKVACRGCGKYHSSKESLVDGRFLVSLCPKCGQTNFLSKRAVSGL